MFTLIIQHSSKIHQNYFEITHYFEYFQSLALIELTCVQLNCLNNLYSTIRMQKKNWLKNFGTLVNGPTIEYKVLQTFLRHYELILNF